MYVPLHPLQHLASLNSLWTTVPLWSCEILLVTFWKRGRGRPRTEFTTASWSWNNRCPCQRHPCHAPGYAPSLWQSSGTTRSLPKPKASPRQNENCSASLPLLHLQAGSTALSQPRKPTCEDELGLRVGSSPFALAKSKKVRLEKQVLQKARGRLSYWKALSVF